MKNIFPTAFAALLLLFAKQGLAQSAAADSIDVLHYDLRLDMGRSTARQLRAEAEITFVLTRSCEGVDFDLICDSLFPVSLDGIMTRGFSYDPALRLLHVNIGGGTAGDTHTVRVPYVSNGHVESYDWGGLHMDNGIYYTLGVAFRDYPHVYGRSWFPCRDNFYDKATYRIAVSSQPGWRSICSGLPGGDTALADGSRAEVWLLQHPVPTYLVGVSSAPWHILQRDFAGAHTSYPSIIGYSSHDSAGVQRTFDILDDVLPAYERAFGPYRWDRIGYIATPKGSMEHVSNIGLVSACMTDTSQGCQMVVCHELAHAWFGNLVTCAGEGDMWINEGGATFCEELAQKAAFGQEAADDYYQRKLSAVLRTSHLADQGFRSLSGMDPRHTYGTTTYDKGAMVWHSLRGYMGDSLFYSSMRRLFDRCAFGNLDAASLRDSLSLYSGLDLAGFFDFHVFQPGFVDYGIEQFSTQGRRASLTLRQRLRGTSQYARANRVPVAFYSADHSVARRWMEFDDSVATASFDLPFEAAFAVADPDHLISDACTDDTLLITGKGLRTLPHAFCKTYCPQAPADGIWLHVGHHCVHPGGTLPEGVTRIASRYWQVSGIIPWTTELQGRFLYNMGASDAAGAGSIDAGFYDNRQTLDSLCLLYRPDPSQPWQCVSRQRASGSISANGYFTARLFAGQYTLAVADSALLSAPAAPQAPKPAIRILPNPNRGEFSIDLGAYDKNFNLSIIDSSGRKILEKNNMHSGATLRHQLPGGTYIVLIQNNFISLQSQIVIQ